MMKNTTYQKRRQRLKALVLYLVLSAALPLYSQVAYYDFSQSQSTYVPLSSPTVLAQATAANMENTRYATELPFGFAFNGVTHNRLQVHSSGFVSFGANAPFGSTPLSNSSTVFDGAIAALGASIVGRYEAGGIQAKISHQTLGVQPHRTLVIQWENFGFFEGTSPSTSSTYNLNFQIRLGEDGTISTVYDLSAVGSPPSFSAQIGLRGNSPSDFNNRYAVGNTSTNNLMSSNRGTANTSVVFVYKDFLPQSGFTFTWAPSSFCLPVFQYNADSEMITRVIFNTIDHTSPAQSGSTPIYEDFRAISTEVQKGESYMVSVKGPAGSFSSDVMVYIDFNQNGRYDDPGEGFYLGKIPPANPFNAHTISGNIPIPASAIPGRTGLRIVKNSGIIATNSISGPCATDLRAGQVEDYTVNILETATTPICTNADPGLNPGDTGCITLTYQGRSVVYTTVRAQDGQIWIQQNLGSPAVASSATDAANYGDLFQWGRWDDGHQLRTAAVSTAAPSPNNPLGLQGGLNAFVNSQPQWWSAGSTPIQWNASNPQQVTADNGCDPCKALGADWAIPTDVQWRDIIAAEGIVNIQSAFDSHLKLTVAGFRGSADGITNAGLRGYYWSKTSSPTNPDYSKYLFYSNLTMNPNAGANRSQGSSVRCIKASPQTEPVFPAPYCGLEGVTTSTVSEITELRLGGVTHSSAFGQPNAPLIEDFTATVIALSKESAHPIVVKGGTQGQTTVSVYAYIDWNHNGIFDSDEAINLGYLIPADTGGTSEMGELTASLTIPATALLGQTRLRLVKAYESSSSMGTLVNLPCPTGWFIGQVEDYTLDITAAVVVPPAERLEVRVQNNGDPLIASPSGTLQLEAQVFPAAADQAVRWTLTSGAGAATVNAEGLATALANGSAVIRATAVSDAAIYAELTVVVDIPTPCPQPTALRIDNLRFDRATAAWSFSQAAVFEYEWRTSGLAGSREGLVQRGQTEETSVILQNLTPNTPYHFYVRTRCENGTASLWTAAASFATPCSFVGVPTAATQRFCGDKQIADLMVSGMDQAVFKWYDTETAARPLEVNTRLQSKSYFVSQSLNGCESERIAVEVHIAPGISAPQASNQSFCTTEVTLADLQVSAAANAVVSWYSSINSSVPLGQNQRLTAGYYYVSQKIGDCESARVMVNISVIDNSVAPVVTAQQFCGSAAVGELRANLISGMQARWYTEREGGSFLSVDTPLVSGVYYVAQGWNGCESPRTSVAVQIHAIPEKPTAAAIQELREGALIGDFIVAAQNPIWYSSLSDAQYDRNRLSPESAVMSDTTYYVVDRSAAACSSEPLAVKALLKLKIDGFDPDHFSYYPNPTADYLWVKYQEVMTSYRIYDLGGRQLMAVQTQARELQIDLSPYQAGVYLIYIHTSNRQQLIRVLKK
ncbi:GEVED domain-containing protein [Flavobacterium sp. JP2137]|uniref:GEVED domain-containing protein n=1 Tax=Flavobacterium sp. JP2137 TaxID=3414510 RepID=UPI003D2FD2B2